MNTEIFKGKRVLNYFAILKYIMFFLVMFIFQKAGIKNNIFPFAIGFFISLVWCNQNMIILAGMFLLTTFLATFSVQSLIISSVCAGIILSVFLLHRQIKKPIKLYLLVVYAVLSQGMSLYYNYGNGEKLLSAIFCIVLATLFMYVCITIFRALLVRGVALRLTIDETICLSVFLLAISLGLSSLTLFNIEISKIYAVFLILLATYIYGGAFSVVLGAVLGLGQALSFGDLSFTAAYTLLALSALTFKSSNVYYSILAVCLTDITLGLYFNIYGSYTIYSFLSVAVGEGLFMLVGRNTLAFLKIIFGGANNQNAIRNVVNRSRDGLCKRMFEISDIFFEMNRVFRTMVKGVLPAEEAKRMLTQEVMQKVCADCPERHKCLRVMAEETSQVFDDIVSAGFERGKATILDVPPFLSTRCTRVNTILSAINQLIVSYKQYANMVNSMDTSRVLVADQLFGISELLKALASETKKNVSFDITKENAIIEELNYYNVVVSEVVLYEQDIDSVSVTMVVRERDRQNPNLEKAVSKICGTKMLIISSVQATVAGFYVNEFKTAPKYDLVYGSCGCPKNGNTVSGDSYTFLKLTEDKVLLAICDGMGSGAEAQKTSDVAISLIENFYKAGFDNEIILSSVNRLLSINSEEVYSALDLCVVDLKSSSADFIKVGAPEGFLKHKTETEILKSGALPLGILEEMKPTIIKKLLDSSDILVMCSDGVLGCYESLENFNVFVNNISTNNPQTIADLILDQALLKCRNQPQDDCTVICARVFPRI